MNNVPCHCSVCNKLFLAPPNLDLDDLVCLHCGSQDAHYADATCKGISYKEWKDDETIASIANSIPNTDGYLDEYFFW